MCGIAGIFRYDGDEVQPETLNHLIKPIVPRGPDSSGMYCESSVGLAHTRLAIMDPHSRANQPMLNDRWILVYNGEIYNFQELRGELLAQGLRFRTTGDTEVILQAIDQWGVTETLEKLQGMYAFAAYDRRARRLHLVRDPFGMKPLFFTENKFGVSFASWPSSLLTLPDCQWTFDPDGLWEYFLLGYPFSGKTLVREIQELNPGDHLVIDDEGSKRRATAMLEIGSDPVSPTQFFETFDEVVSSHGLSDVPAAIFLSGGVDSSALQLALPEVTPFHLYSEEAKFAERVAEHVGHTLDVRNFEASGRIDEMIKNLTRTTGLTFFSPIQSLIISNAMAEAGYKVAFSANGGDELFLGYSRIATPGFMPDLSGLPFERPSFQDFESQIRHIFRSPETILIAGRSVEETAERAADFLSDQRNSLVSTGISESAAYRWFDIENSIKHNLNPSTDATSMLFGLEVRTPFIDKRLVSCALSMPPEVLITSDLGRKAPLKSYLRSKGLPDDIFLRPKMGFSLNREASFQQRNTRLAALKRLSELGLFHYHPSTGLLGRDFNYVAAAAEAAVAWYEGFVETDIVSL